MQQCPSAPRPIPLTRYRGKNDQIIKEVSGFPYKGTAGAPNVLVTLWSLKDGEAGDVMIAFYRTWLSQAGRSDPAKAGAKPASLT